MTNYDVVLYVMSFLVASCWIALFLAKAIATGHGPDPELFRDRDGYIVED